jgi:hypothetical protein
MAIELETKGFTESSERAFRGVGFGGLEGDIMDLAG